MARLKMKNKKALSQIVSITVLILLTVVLIGATWTIINNFLEDRLEGSESCLQVFDSVQLNSKYTCYNATSNETLVSVIVGDVHIDSLLISVSYSSDSENFELTNVSQSFEGLLNYNVGRTSSIVVPGKDTGRTFIVTRSGRPDSIQIAPKIGKKQCEVLDEVKPVSNCN